MKIIKTDAPMSINFMSVETTLASRDDEMWIIIMIFKVLLFYVQRELE